MFGSQAVSALAASWFAARIVHATNATLRMRTNELRNGLSREPHILGPWMSPIDEYMRHWSVKAIGMERACDLSFQGGECLAEP
jgi:hypothetical protein